MLRVAEVNWADDQDSGSRSLGGWQLAWRTFPSADFWQTRAEAAAVSACRARGAKYVAGSATFAPGHSDFSRSGVNRGEGLGWFYRDIEEVDPAKFNYQARQSRTWTATCKKTVRRTRK